MKRVSVVQNPRVVAVLNDHIYKSLHTRRDITFRYHEKRSVLARGIPPKYLSDVEV